MSVTIPSTTAGNCLIVCIDGYNSSALSQSVSGVTLGGSAGNFSQMVTNTTTLTFVAIWADPNCAGGQTTVVISGTNLSTSSGAGGYVVVYEVSGLATASVLDQSSSATGTSTAWSSGATATTTQASEFWVGTAMIQGVVTVPGAPWITTRNSATQACAGYQIASTTGSATFGNTQSGNFQWSAAVVTLKSLAAAATALPPRIIHVPNPAVLRAAWY